MVERRTRHLGAGAAAAVTIAVATAAAMVVSVPGGLAGAAKQYHWTTKSRQTLLADVQKTLGTSTVLLDGTIHISAGDQGGDVHLQGGLNLASHEGQFSVALNLASTSVTIHEILSGGTLYLQIPSGQWYSVSLSQLQAKEGVSGSIFGEGNPTDFLSLIQQAGGQVAQTGTSTLSDGTPVTAYHILLNLDAANNAHRAAGQQAYTPARLHQLEQAIGSHTIAFDAQVDGQGRVRTLSTDLSIDPSALGQQSATGPVGVALDFSFSGYGSPVTIGPPPSSVEPLPSSALSGGGPTA